ncbi:MAG TPA: MBL fold metallo-hydrolase [Verrucomicrobiota bacterium]|nr:MBL fold metallo-hydrolase [Verrucomicrobiota bacterium]HNU52048.1 MBL fold metallo-hydrolase [Verrucomicrobiota bacterium]
MNETITVTVLVENSAHARGLMGEHGLAYHVQAGARSVLFDTGQTDLVVRNARRLGVDLSRLEAVALSHGHFDHSGGVAAVWAQAPDAVLYAHPAARGPHFARNPDGSTRSVGMESEILEAIATPGRRRQETVAPTQLIEGLFLTGEIPRTTGFEDVGGPFVQDAAGVCPDPLADDQALFFDTPGGIVVLLGCAHAGVVNTLRHIRHVTGGRPFHTVLGGMHLVSAGAERMARTVEALRDASLRRLGPAHCTGAAATARLWHEFPEACTVCSVGSRFVFER